MAKYEITGRSNARFVRTSIDSCVIRTIGWSISEYSNPKLCLIDLQGEMCILLPFEAENDQIRIGQMDASVFSSASKERYMVCLSYEQEGVVYYNRLVSRYVMKQLKEEKAGVHRSETYRFGSVLATFEKEGKAYVAQIYVSIKGRFSVWIKPKKLVYKNMVEPTVKDIAISGSVVTTKVSLKKGSLFPEKLVLQFRTKKEDRKCVYEMETTVEETKNTYQITGTLDVGELSFTPIYWDFMLLAMDGSGDGIHYQLQPKNHKQSFKDKFLRLRQEIAYRTKNGYILFPFVTKKDALAFKYREVNEGDSFWFRLRERMARKIYEKHKDYWDAKNICLVYEKYCMAAQDNGFYFFDYCMKHQDKTKGNIEFYYMIDKKSPDYKKVRKYRDRIVPFLSLRHMIYIQAAKLLISTDSKAHAYAWRQKGSILYDTVQSKKNVFLQHGVIGFKNITSMYGKKTGSSCNLFIASSEREKEIIHNELGYANKNIKVTGLARWDVLKHVDAPQKEIVVMPTWRSWLDSVTDEEFCQSSYYKHYEGLLSDGDLQRFMEEEDLTITFYLHPIMGEFIKDFSVCNPRIRLISFGEQPLNEIIMRAKLMITDYSSAAWDMFYLKKPVIFYQFDVEDYEAVHGSYLDFEKDLFGRRAFSIEELVYRIKQVAKDGYQLEKEYLAKWDDAFAYVDHNNSERILEAINKLI